MQHERHSAHVCRIKEVHPTLAAPSMERVAAMWASMLVRSTTSTLRPLCVANL